MRLVRSEWLYDALSREARAAPPEEGARRTVLADDVRSWGAAVLVDGRWTPQHEGERDLPEAVRIDFEIGKDETAGRRVATAWPGG